MDWPTLVLFLWLACLPLGGFLADVRGRRVQHGLIVGGVFGPIGLLLIWHSSRLGHPDSPLTITKGWLAVVGVVLLVGLFLWVLAVGLGHACPSGQHPESAGAGDYTCDYDR